jgi:spore maturation protein SpmA
MVKSTGQAAYQGAWNYTLPIVSTESGSVLAHCKNAAGKEAMVQTKVSADTNDLTLTPVPLLPDKVGQAALASAKASVNLAIGLIGYIALFLGLMKIVENAGGLQWMAGLIRPLLVRLFPDVPPDHPAMGAMVMNIAANALGLGNAATPFGLKAMKELNDLNPHKGTATNAMCLFLAINTSGLALLPTGIIGLRAQFGAADPAAIFPTTLIATGLSTVVGVLAAKGLSKLFASPETDVGFVPPVHTQSKGGLGELVPLLIFGLCLVVLVFTVYSLGEIASVWIMPTLIFGMLLVGVVRGVPVYESFIEGAKEGFNLGVMIIPYLIAILSAIGMFRASGGLEMMVGWIEPITSFINLPGEVLPLALLRPLSGSGAFGITAELVQTYGADSYIGNLASTMNGSTETTFYVLAVYFGSVGVHRYRHALWAGLAADITGVFASILAVSWLLGS